MNSIKNPFSGIGGKKLIWLAVAAIIGVILIIFGSLGKADKTKTAEIPEENSDTEAYIGTLENKIRNITEQITGDENPAVIITAKSGIESLYVYDEKTGSDSKEQDYITVKNSDGAGSLVLRKRIYPEIEGVSIACSGGDNPQIQMKLINAVSTALGISSNRICIVGTK